jgi:hypothetical protein
MKGSCHDNEIPSMKRSIRDTLGSLSYSSTMSIAIRSSVPLVSSRAQIFPCKNISER